MLWSYKKVLFYPFLTEMQQAYIKKYFFLSGICGLWFYEVITVFESFAIFV